MAFNPAVSYPNNAPVRDEPVPIPNPSQHKNKSRSQFDALLAKTVQKTPPRPSGSRRGQGRGRAQRGGSSRYIDQRQPHPYPRGESSAQRGRGQASNCRGGRAHGPNNDNQQGSSRDQGGSRGQPRGRGGGRGPVRGVGGRDGGQREDVARGRKGKARDQASSGHTDGSRSEADAAAPASRSLSADAMSSRAPTVEPLFFEESRSSTPFPTARGPTLDTNRPSPYSPMPFYDGSPPWPESDDGSIHDESEDNLMDLDPLIVEDANDLPLAGGPSVGSFRLPSPSSPRRALPPGPPPLAMSASSISSAHRPFNVPGYVPLGPAYAADEDPFLTAARVKEEEEEKEEGTEVDEDPALPEQSREPTMPDKEEEVLQVRAELQREREETTRLQLALVAKDAEIYESKRTANALEDSVRRLEQDALEHDATVNLLRDGVDHLTHSVDAKRADITSCEARICSLLADLSEKDRQLEALRVSSSETERRALLDQRSREAIQAELATTKESLTAALRWKPLHDESMSAVDALQERARELEAQITAWQARWDDKLREVEVREQEEQAREASSAARISQLEEEMEDATRKVVHIGQVVARWKMQQQGHGAAVM